MDQWEDYIKKIDKLKSNKIDHYIPKKENHSNQNFFKHSLIKNEISNIKSIDPKDLTPLKRSKIRKMQNDEIDARIDLHGLTLSQAETALRNFIENAIRLKNRNILVITGKGKINYDEEYKEGKIKYNFPTWMNNLQHLIKHYIPAPARLGGEGAFIVYLKN